MTRKDWVAVAVSAVVLGILFGFAFGAIVPNRVPRPDVRCASGTPVTWSSHDGDGQQITNVQCVP